MTMNATFTILSLNRVNTFSLSVKMFFDNKTFLLNHIKSDHVQETCKRFQENKCNFGERFFYRHTINARSVRTQQESSVSNTPHVTTQQVFQQAPTFWNSVVGPQNNSDIKINLNQITKQI